MHCLDREALAHRHLRNRSRSRELFDCIAAGHHEDRPIPLRNPLAFYEGHLPVFAVNTLLKLAIGERGIDEHFERLFARGIDPDDVRALAGQEPVPWPDRAAILAYGEQRVRIPAAACAVSFSRGETLWTESSYKYGPGEVGALGTSAGLVQQWLDEAGFALSSFAKVSG